MTGIGAAPSKFSREYVSSDQTITSAGALTLAHGLGVEPKTVALFLVCQVAELGYSIGDVVGASVMTSQNNAVHRGVSAVVDATNVTLRFGSDAAAFEMLTKSGGVRQALTNTRWLLRVKAWA